MKSTRELLIAALDSENGVSEAAFELIYAIHGGNPDLQDIFGHVEATDDCFYLPEGWNK